MAWFIGVQLDPTAPLSGTEMPSRMGLLVLVAPVAVAPEPEPQALMIRGMAAPASARVALRRYLRPVRRRRGDAAAVWSADIDDLLIVTGRDQTSDCHVHPERGELSWAAAVREFGLTLAGPRTRTCGTISKCETV